MYDAEMVSRAAPSWGQRGTMSPTGVKVVPHMGYKDFCCTPQHFPRSVEAPPSLRSLRPKQSFIHQNRQIKFTKYKAKRKEKTMIM
jgi:hypothetical protein